jgi:hypothetical protein
MATKYQVFVSSTYEDLREERDQVIKAVLEMGHIPVGMEMFSAADEEQWQIIARHIEESDYYVVIIAHRYGSVTDGISYTRKEYEYARSLGIPVLAFIIDDSAEWPADRIDKTDEMRELLADFKNRVREKPVGKWTSARDLYGMVSIALGKAFNTQPRVGWIRASEAAGPEMTAELARLSAENARLRAAMEAAARADEADHDAAMTKLRTELRGVKRSLIYRYPKSDWEAPVERNLSQLFVFLSPTLLSEASISKCAIYLALFLAGEQEKREGGFVAHNLVQDLLADFMVFDLVEPSKKSHSVRDTEEYWVLTDSGRDFLKWARRQGMLSEASEPSEPESKHASADSVEKPPAEKPPAEKPPAEKPTAEKAPAKKAPAKKAPAKR